jgi:phosphatidylglycerol:prolipoprotein diacylglycerol transferase
VFPPESPAGVYAAECAAANGLDIVALHPTQLYSSSLALVTLVLLLALQNKLKKRGAAFGTLLLCYGASRFSLDFIRFYEDNMRVFMGLTLNQLISIGFFVVGLYLLLRKTDLRTVPVSGAGKKR